MDQKLMEAIATELQVEPEALRSSAELASFPLWDSLTRLNIMVILSDATSCSRSGSRSGACELLPSGPSPMRCQRAS
jgi:hypothetical protein